MPKKHNKRVRHSSRGKVSLQELYRRDGGVCSKCDRHISINEATRDHTKPRSKGGSNKRANMKLMCYQCNQIKADSYG